MNLKEQLLQPLINLIKDLVGDQLSQSPSSTGTTPSVIQSRSNTPAPNFPYCSVEYRNIDKVGSFTRDQYINEDNEEVTEVDFIVRMVVRFHASESQDALGLAQSLKNKIMTSKGKKLIRNYFSNASLLKMSNVSFFPSLMITDHQEESRITLYFWTRNIIVDENVDIIENVNINGELYDHYDQDYPPLTLNLNAP